jgi:hypothetical protein
MVRYVTDHADLEAKRSFLRWTGFRKAKVSSPSRVPFSNVTSGCGGPGAATAA